MRVKRQKPDDLIDALKHLKIADRRSRLSFRGGRPTGSLAFLGSSSLEQTLRCRLTRSASSNSAGIHHYGAFSNYPCDCCCAMGHHQTRADPIDVVECPMCSRLSCRGSTQLAGGLSPIPAVNSAAVSAGSGFTTSAGLLYSTLPTNLEFRHGRHPDLSHSQHVLQSDKLRRSCGAGLSHLDFDPVIFETGDLCGSECASSSSIITRCRRNSDPEQWQLVKTMRICTTDDPPRVNQITNRGDTQPLSYSRPACDLQTGQLGVGSNAHRSFLTRSLQTDDQRSHWNFCSTQRNVSRVSTEDPSTYYRDPLLANPHSTVFRDGIEYTGVRTNPVSSLHPPRLQAQQHQEQGSLSEPSHKMDCSLRSFSFRPSVLSSQFPEASQPPSSAVSSTTLVPGPFHLSTKPCGDSIGSTSSNPGSKQVNICPEDSSLSWSGMKEPSASTVDRQTQSVVAILQSDDGTSMQSLQQNLPLLEGSSDTTNGGAGRSQLTSDISVNELAAYMEHMVHIPGRMSEMAQRMYL
ncbi:unnamed protein product [Echinostoma caproni]|uniref:Non-specific serine/threonine protein kinase n=1 Tax=Echinostoma caproni TaxID=27848 RepID=A0A183AP69_9TREM|nr:unnamed protein product [Echinostoma caproni]